MLSHSHTLQKVSGRIKSRVKGRAPINYQGPFRELPQDRGRVGAAWQVTAGAPALKDHAGHSFTDT